MNKDSANYFEVYNILTLISKRLILCFQWFIKIFEALIVASVKLENPRILQNFGTYRLKFTERNKTRDTRVLRRPMNLSVN